MKIDGIDPLLLNRIKEQVDRMEVQKTEQTVTDNRVSRERGSSRGKVVEMPDQNNRHKVEAALRRLNENAEKGGIELRFDARRSDNLWHVLVMERDNNKVIRDIPTDQALSVVNRLQSLFGGLLDEKR